jgi:hypothetical protein
VRHFSPAKSISFPLLRSDAGMAEILCDLFKLDGIAYA